MSAADWTDEDGVECRDLSPREQMLVAALAQASRDRDALRAAIPGAFRRGVQYRETTNAPIPDDHGIRVRVGYDCGAVVLDPPVVSTRVGAASRAKRDGEDGP